MTRNFEIYYFISYFFLEKGEIEANYIKHASYQFKAIVYSIAFNQIKISGAWTRTKKQKKQKLQTNEKCER